MTETSVNNSNQFGMPTETEKSNEQEIVNPYIDRGSSKPKEESSSGKFVKEESQFVSKGANRKLDKPHNIRFQMGGGTFNNLITFINEINYDVAFLFRKKEMFMIAIDGSTTHCAVINFSRIELSIYDVKFGENEDNDSEKGILIDISSIIEELSMRDEQPVDMYIDTLERNRFYVITGKEIVERQLNAINTSDGIDTLLQKYRNFGLKTMMNLISNPAYQKIVVNQIPLSNLIKSLTKKTSKKKDETTLCSVYLNKHYIDWRIESEVKSSSIMLSDNDILVYPLEEDKWQGVAEYINKFGKLNAKGITSVSMYANGSLPLIFEIRLGGNGIVCRYLIAPRVDDGR